MNPSATVGEFDARQLRRVVALLDAHEDVLAERVTGRDPPTWGEARGWSEFLLGLDEDVVAAAETGGAAEVLRAHPRTPEALRALADEALEACSVHVAAPVTRAPALRRASPRKRDQIEALAALTPRGATRVLDFGSGRGHLTRRLAKAIGVPAVGFERSPAVVEAARTIDPDPAVRFESREIGPSFDVRPGDLLVGLHACGGLGDALIRCAVDSGAAVLLVPCCPQKIQTDVRAPLSGAGRPLARELLGLANLAAAEAGVSAAGVAAHDAARRRRTRLALRALLADAGVEESPGGEARGINRKRFREGLAAVAPLAFGRRGLARPSDAAIRQADERAVTTYARIRRLSLPRAVLARPLELAIVWDRAAALAEAGGPTPTVVEAFPSTVSPRNLLIRRGFYRPAADSG